MTIFVCLVILLGLVNIASAIEWTGAGADASFCTPENWAGGIVPGPGDDAWIDCCNGQGDADIDCDVEVDALRGPAMECDCSQNMIIRDANVVVCSWRACYEGDKTSHIWMLGNTRFTVTCDGSSFRFGDDGGDNTHCYLHVCDNSILNLGGRFRCGDNGGHVVIDIGCNAVVNVAGYMRIGDDGGGSFSVSGNAKLTVQQNLYFVCRQKSTSADVSGNCEIWVGEDFRMGNPGQMGDKADTVNPMTMSGGTINCENLQIGWEPKNAATASLTMTGGLIICRENVMCGSTSTITIEPGGVIMPGGIEVEAGGTGNINLVGTDVANSGLIILDGNKLPEVWALVIAGLLTGNGSFAGIQADYDVANPRKTTVWAEEPEIPKPCRAYAPFPYNTMQGVGTGSDIHPFTPLALRWSAGDGLGLGRHYLYFGDDYDCVANAACGDTSVPCVKAMIRASTTSWTPPDQPLDLWKTYYWRIDEVGVACCMGKVWRFTTGCNLIPGDINLDCVVNFEDFAAVAETFGEQQFWPED
jgi:hypothetical protein